MKKFILAVAMMLFATSAFGFDGTDCHINRWYTDAVTIDKIAGTTCTNAGKIGFWIHPIGHKLIVQESNVDFTTWIEACYALDQYEENCRLYYDPGPIGSPSATSVFGEIDFLSSLGQVVIMGPVAVADRRLIELAFLYELYMVPDAQACYQIAVAAGLNDNQKTLFMSGCFVTYGLDSTNAESAASEFVLNSVKKKYNDLGLTKVDAKWKRFLTDFGSVWFE